MRKIKDPAVGAALCVFAVDGQSFDDSDMCLEPINVSEQGFVENIRNVFKAAMKVNASFQVTFHPGLTYVGPAKSKKRKPFARKAKKKTYRGAK